METIRIAVGSKRAPKLGAVREALVALGPLLRPKSNFEVTGFEVETGVSHTPRSRTELMAGARGRCGADRRTWPGGDDEGAGANAPAGLVPGEAGEAGHVARGQRGGDP